MKKTVLLFTDSFPFGSNEPFLEAEILEWGKRDDIKLIIFPLLNKKGSARTIPLNATYDITLQKVLGYYEKWVFFLFPVIFINPFFWKELKTFIKNILNIKKVRKLVAVSTFSIVIYFYLKRNYKKALTSESIFYSYWFYYASYAGALLKRKNYNFKLITRAHGTDIFQNRPDTGCFIPFRKFPVWKYFSKIYTVSDSGKNYLHQNQNIPLSKLEVSNLGVNVPENITPGSSKNKLVVVSCSNIISVKRIDLIINGLESYKLNYPDIELFWHHIGSGELSKEIMKMAANKLSSTNIGYKFHGQLKNSEVISFYENTNIDCFILTSSSEGLPVSIMEALSFGIPVLATAVGGIPESVNKDVGYLLNPDFSTSDFITGLNKMYSFKSQSKRKTIAKWGKQKYNASVNYNQFINKVLTSW